MTPESTNEPVVAEVAPEVATPTTVTEVAKPNNRNLIIGIVTTLVALALGYVFLFTETELTSLVPFKDSQAVAIVNGEKIERFELNKSTEDLLNSLAGQGMDTTAEGVRAQVEQEALTRLINTKLLLQKALAAGHTASEEETTTQLAAIETGFGGRAGLDTRLGELGITYDMLVEDVKEQIVVTGYLEATTPITGITNTAEEIDAYYATLKTQYGENLPPLEEIKDQVDQELKAQKQQQIVAEVIEGLKRDATIEVKI